MVVQVAGCQSWSRGSPLLFPHSLHISEKVQVASCHSCKHRKRGSLITPKWFNPYVVPKVTTRSTITIRRHRGLGGFPVSICLGALELQLQSRFGHSPVSGSSCVPHYPQNFAISHLLLYACISQKVVSISILSYPVQNDIFLSITAPQFDQI